jgi:metal-dependent HD superfamily phosphatase/phosphodiesterase
LSLAVYFDKPQPLELEAGMYRVSKGIQLTPGRQRLSTMTVRASFRIIG